MAQNRPLEMVEPPGRGPPHPGDSPRSDGLVFSEEGDKRSSGSSSSTLRGNCILSRQLFHLVLVCRLQPMLRLLRAGNPFKNLRCRDNRFGSRLQTWPTPGTGHQWLSHLHPGKIIPISCS
ncbi:hypothetical protein HPB50_006143 [Hyalomma asiaticum]|uniref:Uncharacterized protein n=1 Tax=Hyalomma asiaticum TaxID=266040 RepID=A0ACB7TD18_HYAAI|nr:hypothetical protein HPB50_006143 [Hyalomma asiaticum]